MQHYRIIQWVLRITAALIMLQTLFYKFSGSPESVYIFSTLGIEPWGRIGTGIAELIAGALLLMNRTYVFGALMGIGIMAGAVLSHVFVLGIAVMGDGGWLFTLALITMAACTALCLLNIPTTLKLIKLKFR